MTRLDYPNRQPAFDIMRAQARTMAGVARLLNVPYHQLREALIGQAPPTPVIRHGVPLLLQRAPAECWTTDDRDAVTA